MKTMMGILLLALGLTTSATSAVTAVTSMTGFSDSLQRVDRRGTVRLEEAGRYMIFYETRTLVDGQTYLAPRGGSLKFAMFDASNTELELAAVNGSYRYSFGAHEGVAVGQFTITEPGEFTLLGAHVGDGPVVLAVARPLSSSIAKTFAFAFLALLGVAVLMIGLVLFLTARTNRRRQATS